MRVYNAVSSRAAAGRRSKTITIPGNVGHVPRRNLDETCAAFAGQSPVLTEVELDLVALLVQNREDAGLAVASEVVPRKLDGYSRLGELVGG